MKEGSATKLDRLKWEGDGGIKKRMTPIQTIDYMEPNVKKQTESQMLKTKQKKKEERKKKILLLPTVWKGDLRKTPPYHRASSPWAYMRTFTTLL